MTFDRRELPWDAAVLPRETGFPAPPAPALPSDSPVFRWMRQGAPASQEETAEEVQPWPSAIRLVAVTPTGGERAVVTGQAPPEWTRFPNEGAVWPGVERPPKYEGHREEEQEVLSGCAGGGEVS